MSVGREVKEKTRNNVQRHLNEFSFSGDVLCDIDTSDIHPSLSISSSDVRHSHLSRPTDHHLSEQHAECQSNLLGHCQTRRESGQFDADEHDQSTYLRESHSDQHHRRCLLYHADDHSDGFSSLSSSAVDSPALVRSTGEKRRQQARRFFAVESTLVVASFHSRSFKIESSLRTSSRHVHGAIRNSFPASHDGNDASSSDLLDANDTDIARFHTSAIPTTTTVGHLEPSDLLDEKAVERQPRCDETTAAVAASGLDSQIAEKTLTLSLFECGSTRSCRKNLLIRLVRSLVFVTGECC